MLLSTITYSQDYELYTGIALHERSDIKVGYLIGANFIIKTKQGREYLNNIIFGIEHSGYAGSRNTMSSTNNNNSESNCECEVNDMSFSRDYTISYRHLIRGITINMGVEIKDNWYLTVNVNTEILTIMKDITWELKNLDSLKEYIFDELIGEHKNTKDINEAINRYAERYHEMQLKLLNKKPTS